MPAMEKLFFAKVELWVVLLLAILGGVFMVGFAAMVKHTASGGEKMGRAGEIALQVADLPINAAAILTGQARKEDYIDEGVFTAMPRDQYQVVAGIADPKLDKRPLFWTSGAQNLQPVAMMFRLNEASDEGLLILDGARKVVRVAPITGGSLSGKFQPLVGNAAPVMLDDGSLIVFSNGSDGVYRKDLCGKVLWSAPGLYHHSYSVADGKIGLLGLPHREITDRDRGELTWNHSEVINVLDAATGRIERSVRLDEIARANAPFLDPFSWRLWQQDVNAHGVLEKDLIHLNKIELLPAAMAASYPGLPAGAWMLSSRNLNLLVIVDPQTLKILWHAQGHTQAQHDPEFAGNGRILVFNNGLASNTAQPADAANFSSVRQYDFGSGEWSEPYNAAGVKGFTGHSGELDFGADGSLLLNLTAQGRYLEVSPAGEVLSEFINVRNDGQVYWTKHAQYLTEAQLDIARSLTCDT